MGGWKTKTGGVLTALGGGLMAGSKVVPPNELQLEGWLAFSGTILMAVGGSLMAYGVAHKGEKNAEKIAAAVKKES